MKLVKYIIWLCLGMSVFPVGAQIRFIDGDFNAALEKAKAEKKMVFADFWAEWCGPCKMMAAEVFSLPEAGEYFNAHFICVKVDVEAAAGKDLAERFGITSLPTMAFIAADGKEVRRVEGSVPVAALLQEARIVTGEDLSFEQLYDKYRKNKKDMQTVQELLLRAPGFMSVQSGMNRDKWGARIDVLFPEYVKNKQLKHMVNEDDFSIITFYHGEMEKNDPIFDFVVSRYDEYAELVGKEAVTRYIIGLNNSAIIRMCKKGDREGYLKRIEQMDGNLEKVYAGIKFGSLPVRKAITLLADGTFYLHKGDENRFFEKMDAYFTAVGDSLSVSDYVQPLEDLYRVSQGKLSVFAQQKAIGWIQAALQKEMTADSRTRLLVMLGDCYAGTGEREKAKQSYGRALLESAPIPDEAMRKKLQGTIQHKMQVL